MNTNPGVLKYNLKDLMRLKKGNRVRQIMVWYLVNITRTTSERRMINYENII